MGCSCRDNPSKDENQINTPFVYCRKLLFLILNVIDITCFTGSLFPMMIEDVLNLLEIEPA